jgi:hypothetical protein
MNQDPDYQFGWNLAKTLFEAGRAAGTADFARKKAASKSKSAAPGRSYTRGAGKSKSDAKSGTSKRAKPKCSKGIACGNSCIPANRKCTSEAPSKTSKGAAKYVKQTIAQDELGKKRLEKKVKAANEQNKGKAQPPGNVRLPGMKKIAQEAMDATKRREDLIAKAESDSRKRQAENAKRSEAAKGKLDDLKFDRPTKPKARNLTPADWAKQERAKKPAWWGKLPDGVEIKVDRTPTALRSTVESMTPAELRQAMRSKDQKNSLGRVEYIIRAGKAGVPVSVTASPVDDRATALMIEAPGHRLKELSPREKVQAMQSAQQVISAHLASMPGGDRVYLTSPSTYERKLTPKQLQRVRDAIKKGRTPNIPDDPDHVRFSAKDQQRFSRAAMAMGVGRSGIVRNGVVIPTGEDGKPDPALAREGVRLRRPGDVVDQSRQVREYLGLAKDDTWDDEDNPDLRQAVRQEIGDPAWNGITRPGDGDEPDVDWKRAWDLTVGGEVNGLDED